MDTKAINSFLNSNFNAYNVAVRATTNLLVESFMKMVVKNRQPLYRFEDFRDDYLVEVLELLACDSRDFGLSFSTYTDDSMLISNDIFRIYTGELYNEAKEEMKDIESDSLFEDNNTEEGRLKIFIKRLLFKAYHRPNLNRMLKEACNHFKASTSVIEDITKYYSPSNAGSPTYWISSLMFDILIECCKPSFEGDVGFGMHYVEHNSIIENSDKVEFVTVYEPAKPSL